MIIIYNVTGLVMIIVSTGIAFGLGYLLRLKAGEPLIMVGGLVAAILDVTYRFTQLETHMFHPKRGGQFFFVPVWMFGLGGLIWGAGSIIRQLF